MIRVIVESPCAAETPELVGRHVLYARDAMRDCLRRGESPFASHVMLAHSGVLDDDKPEDRALGIEAGLIWGAMAQKTVVYIDLGISKGMQQGMSRALREGRPVERRSLPEWRRG